MSGDHDSSGHYGFACRKRSARGSRGAVVTNHPIASGVAAQVLLEGGNAADAAVAALFALSIVEPMMVGILGGGLSHIRSADGTHHIIDALGCAPGAAHARLYASIDSTAIDQRRQIHDRANEIGALAVAVPGALAGWCVLLERHGSWPLADVIDPAIRIASRGFRITNYLATNVAEQARTLCRDPGLAALFMPDGQPLSTGALLRQPEAADTLRALAGAGPQSLYRGALGSAVVRGLTQGGGVLTQDDLAAYTVRDRQPIRVSYRDHEVLGPPPPASSGVHIAQMLNVLESFDLRASGFGSVASTHLLAEAMAMAFADRAVATADPDFVTVPVATLTSKTYARERAGQIDPRQRQRWATGLGRAYESANTTHLTIADERGLVVASTQTLNGPFGAGLMIPGTGLIANNYMYNFDPHPGSALSIAPGKRVFTSMAPLMLLRDGRLRFALGLTGGLRIFPSAMQTIVNLVDHGMSLQQAVEAPRIFTDGGALEVEGDFPSALPATLASMGHNIHRVPRVGGGMNAISFDDGGLKTAAACWRADGTPIAISGGLAREGTGFASL